MITNSTYLLYAVQIGNIFCSNDKICAASVKERLVTQLNNATFQTFLAFLPTDRIFRFQYLQTYYDAGKVKAKIQSIDLVTGEEEIKHWNLYNQGKPDTAADRAYAYRMLLNNLGYTQIQGEVITSKNYPKPIIVRTNKYGNYGITLSTGSTAGTGTGYAVTPGGQIIATPEPVQTDPANIQQPDSGLLNKVLLGVAAYFLLS